MGNEADPATGETTVRAQTSGMLVAQGQITQLETGKTIDLSEFDAFENGLGTGGENNVGGGECELEETDPIETTLDAPVFDDSEESGNFNGDKNYDENNRQNA